MEDLMAQECNMYSPNKNDYIALRVKIVKKIGLYQKATPQTLSATASCPRTTIPSKPPRSAKIYQKPKIRQDLLILGPPEPLQVHDPWGHTMPYML
eukprot:5456455-Amphidinium_carterae.1